MSLRRLGVLSHQLWRVFGARGAAAVLLLAYPPYWLWVTAGQALDRALLSRHAPANDARTIIVTGPPRSGTTFLHRFLAEHTAARPTQLWEALVPAVVWQRPLRPLIRRLARQNRPRIDLGRAHSAGLELPETDDLVVFARHLDSFFYFVYCLSFRQADSPEYLDPAGLPATIATRDLATLAAAARRNRVNGRTSAALLKAFSAGYALDRVLAELPDARVVYVSRAPHETLPSSLSMVRSVLGLRGLYAGCDDAARARHVARVVDASLALQRAAIDGLRGPAGQRVLVVRHEDLIDRFAETMERLLAHVGEQVDDGLRALLLERDAAQRRHASGHDYSLAEFGLSEADVRERFRDVYAYFGHA